MLLRKLFIHTGTSKATRKYFKGTVCKSFFFFFPLHSDYLTNSLKASLVRGPCRATPPHHEPGVKPEYGYLTHTAHSFYFLVTEHIRHCKRVVLLKYAEEKAPF